MLNFKVVASSLAVFGGVTFLVCAFYGLIVPNTLHAHMASFLEGMLPGFRWLSLGSFLLGLVESILYGVYAAALFVPVFNFFQRRWSIVDVA